MENLKNLIWKVLKKRPYTVNVENAYDEWDIHYITAKNNYFSIELVNEGEDSYFVILKITNEGQDHLVIKEVSLSEKEYMEMKWTIESWKDRLDEEALDSFKEFAESGSETIDSLLDE